MTTPGVPSAARGQPPLEQVAADTIQALRGTQRRFPPGYEPHPLTAVERKEADKVAADRIPVCGLCGGHHYAPSTAACPRLASFELDAEGKLRAGTFWKGRKWAKGTVVFKADALEDEEAGDGDDG